MNIRPPGTQGLAVKTEAGTPTEKKKNQQTGTFQEFGSAIVQTSAIGLGTARRIQPIELMARHSPGTAYLFRGRFREGNPRLSPCRVFFKEFMDDATAKDGKTSIIAVPIITDRAGVFFMPLEKDKPMVCEVRGVKGLYLRESKPSTGKFNMVESRGAIEHARELCVGFVHLWKESGFETFEA